MTTTTNDMTQRLNELRTKQEQAQQRYNQATAAYEMAQQAHTQAMSDLAQLGYDSIESAQAAIAELRAQVAGWLDEAEQTLSSVEA